MSVAIFPAQRLLPHLGGTHFMAAFTVLQFLYGCEERAAAEVVEAYFPPLCEGWP